MQSSQPVKLYLAQLKTELSHQNSQPQNVSEDKLAKTEAASLSNIVYHVVPTLKYYRYYLKSFQLVPSLLLG